MLGKEEMTVKKFLCAALMLLFLIPGDVLAEFSASSVQFDHDLAQQALQIAELCYMPSMQEAILALGGYRRMGLYNTERAAEDIRHISSYAVYDRHAEDGHTEVIIAIRGTGEGEWKLNMDLMPSGNYDLPYAENFALAAEDVLTTLQEYLEALESPSFLVTGHSRGAAVANLLGVQLTDRFGADNVFVYTFATPRTVRGEHAAYDNIFNVINPADIVTYLPFPQWGFERYGVDIVLPVENDALVDAAQAAYAERKDQTGHFVSPRERTEAATRFIGALASLAPQLRDGFDIRHALSHPGAAEANEAGMTAEEFLLTLLDGSLSSRGGGADEALSSFAQAKNDFQPVLYTLQTLSGEDAGWISAMHMPATYGAWLSVMQ